MCIKCEVEGKDGKEIWPVSSIYQHAMIGICYNLRSHGRKADCLTCLMAEDISYLASINKGGVFK